MVRMVSMAFRHNGTGEPRTSIERTTDEKAASRPEPEERRKANRAYYHRTKKLKGGKRGKSPYDAYQRAKNG